MSRRNDESLDQIEAFVSRGDRINVALRSGVLVACSVSCSVSGGGNRGGLSFLLSSETVRRAPDLLAQARRSTDMRLANARRRPLRRTWLRGCLRTSGALGSSLVRPPSCDCVHVFAHAAHLFQVNRVGRQHFRFLAQRIGCTFARPWRGPLLVLQGLLRHARELTAAVAGVLRQVLSRSPWARARRHRRPPLPDARRPREAHQDRHRNADTRDDAGAASRASAPAL